MSRRNRAWDTVSQEEAAKVLDQCSYVFVYGTLKTGYGNNKLMRFATCVGERTTKDGYIMGDVGCPYVFPKQVVPAKYHSFLAPIKGEVWDVADEGTLIDLDMLEGHPSHYQRKLVELSDDTKAWCYLQHDWYMAQFCDAVGQDEEGNWVWT